MPHTNGQAQQDTQSELRALLSSTEDLLQSIGESGGEAVEGVKARLRDSITRLRAQLGDAVESAAGVTRRTRDFVMENPWTAVGIGAALGLGIGLTVLLGQAAARNRSWTRYFH